MQRPEQKGGGPESGSASASTSTGAGSSTGATPGSAAFGKYQLFANLGRGGMADVFLAVARGPMGFNKLVVVKRLRSSLAEEASFLGMFLDEARLAARLNHPNVVHTYEVGEHGGAYFIAMEYLEGQSLNKVIKEAQKTGERAPLPVLARIISDALNGLHHAHELRDYDGTPLQIIHRDVSPHNVFVTYDGQVKLVDFGIAKAALSSTQTEVGVLKGKVAYMAPEQAMGGTIDRRADIFAMGIVLWELLTRKRLMTGDSAAATLHRLLNMPVPRLSSVVPEVDPRLDEIVARALEKEPAKRFETALEMREALESYIAGSGVTVRQEDVGRLITGLFAKVREDVQRQVQAHMAAVGNAATTQELAALTLDSLRRFDVATSNPSNPSAGSGGSQGSGHSNSSSPGALLQLGVSSGSGSGVVSHPSAVSGSRGGGSSVAPGLGAVPVPSEAPSARRTGGILAVAVLAVLLLGGVAGVAFVVGSRANVEPVANGKDPGTGHVEGPAHGGLSHGQTGALTAGSVEPGNAGTGAVAPPAVPATAAAVVVPDAGVAVATPPPRPTTVVATPSPPVTPRGVAVSPPAAGGSRPTTREPSPGGAKSADPTPSAAPVTRDEGSGFLTLDTYPWTRVSEGGRVLGTTPLIKINLSAGNHVLTLENPEQGVKQTYSVTIKNGETISRRLAFK